MLKSTDNVHPDHIRNSLFLCVRSVRQMTEQLVTIVASLNDGTNNDSYKSKLNKNPDLRNYSNIVETEKTSCEDMSSESACTKAGYNSTEVFSRNDTCSSRFTSNHPQWNNLNDKIFNSSCDSNIQNSLPRTYKPYANLSSSDIEKNSILGNVRMKTFENEENIGEHYTTPEKFTQTSLIKSLNFKYSEVQFNSPSGEIDKKLDFYSTQNIQTDSPIESNIFPPSTNGKHGKSWHGENISTKLKNGFKNSNNEDLDVYPIIRSKSNDQIKVNQELSSDYSNNINLYSSINPKKYYVYNNRDLTKTFKVYTNISDNFNTSIKVNKTDNLLEKIQPTEIQARKNCFRQSTNLGRRKPNVNINENESVSKIDIELEDLNSKVVDEFDDSTLTVDHIQLNKIEDLSFYDTLNTICDAELSVIGKTLSKKSSEFSDFMSDISMYDSQIEVTNDTHDFLCLSSLEYIESVSEITSPSQSFAEFSEILSAFYEDECHMDRLIKFDSLPSTNSIKSDSYIMENEDKYFSDKIPRKKYLRKFLSTKTISQLSQTNNFKYKTINTTNCVIKNRNNIFDDCFNIPLQDSSNNELSSMKDISTLSAESVTRQGDIRQNSCNITQVSIDKSESRLDLEVIIPPNMNKTNSNTVNNKGFKEIGRLDIKSRARTVGFDRQLYSVESNKEKKNKINNNKENIIDYDELKQFTNYAFTSCVEDCFSFSDCLTVAKKTTNDNSVDLTNNDSELYEIIGVDYDTSKQHNTEITDSNQPKSFLKTYKNNSHSSSQSESVFIQPTLPTFSKFTTTSKSKSPNLHIDEVNISQKDDKKLNKFHSYDNINLSVHLSCFNEELKQLETFKGISQKTVTKRKKVRHKKCKAHHIPSEFVFYRERKRRLKSKDCPQPDSIIECFLDNF